MNSSSAFRMEVGVFVLEVEGGFRCHGIACPIVLGEVPPLVEGDLNPIGRWLVANRPVALRSQVPVGKVVARGALCPVRFPVEGGGEVFRGPLRDSLLYFGHAIHDEWD